MKFSVIGTYDNDIHQLLEMTKKHDFSGCDIVVLTWVWETASLPKWQRASRLLVDAIHKQNPGVKIILMVNSWYRVYRDHFDTLVGVDQVVYLDFFLLLVHWRLMTNQESKLSQQWHSDLKNMLFLTGKPHKINRIRLLYKLSKHRLLNNCTWSLFMTKSLTEQCRKFLAELPDDEYQQFVDTHKSQPDDIPLVEQEYSVHYSGIPYSDNLYNDALFQIVPETDYRKKIPWITEKIWLAIINRRPFIVASSVGTLHKLREMGFRTFNEYLDITDYDDIEDDEARLDAIVHNAASWLVSIKHQEDVVRADTEYNFQRFMQLAEQNITKLKKVILQYGLECEIDQLIPLKDLRAIEELGQWKKFYETVRDPSWPDCDNERDFKKLPESIQKECIEVFKYRPKELF